MELLLVKDSLEFGHPLTSIFAEEFAFGWEGIRIVQGAVKDVPERILGLSVLCMLIVEITDLHWFAAAPPYSRIGLPQSPQNSRCNIDDPLSEMCSFVAPDAIRQLDIGILIVTPNGLPVNLFHLQN